jgi:hypothetical protein
VDGEAFDAADEHGGLKRGFAGGLASKHSMITFVPPRACTDAVKLSGAE